jgi:hypothetical protein
MSPLIPQLQTCLPALNLQDDGEDVVRRKGSPYPLESGLPDWLDGDGIFHRHQHTRTDQDSTGLGFVAKARGDVGYRPDAA